DEEIAAALGLEHDDVRGRCRMIGVDRRSDAAHMHREMRLGEAAVLACGLHGGCRGYRCAERLHRYPRGRSDVVRSIRRGFGVVIRMFGAADHLPVSLSLALSASG